MLVKTPSKPEKTKRNRRKPSQKNKKTASKTHKKKYRSKFGKKISKNRKQFSLPHIPPWKIIFAIIIMGVLGMLYLRHVFATQQLLSEVQNLEQNYQQAKRSHNFYRLTYDRMIGPKEIYNKAKAIGLVDGGPAEKVIQVEPE